MKLFLSEPTLSVMNLADILYIFIKQKEYSKKWSQIAIVLFYKDSVKVQMSSEFGVAKLEYDLNSSSINSINIVLEY